MYIDFVLRIHYNGEFKLIMIMIIII